MITSTDELYRDAQSANSERGAVNTGTDERYRDFQSADDGRSAVHTSADERYRDPQSADDERGAVNTGTDERYRDSQSADDDRSVPWGCSGLMSPPIACEDGDLNCDVVVIAWRENADLTVVSS